MSDSSVKPRVWIHSTANESGLGIDFDVVSLADFEAIKADRDLLLESMQSIAGVETGFEERIARMSRGDLIAMIDTDTRIAREALASRSPKGDVV